MKRQIHMTYDLQLSQYQSEYQSEHQSKNYIQFLMKFSSKNNVVVCHINLPLMCVIGEFRQTYLETFVIVTKNIAQHAQLSLMNVCMPMQRPMKIAHMEGR